MNSAEEKNDFVPLMDMASTSNNSNQNQKNKVIDINEISEQNNSETIDEEESKEKLNLDYNTNLLDVNNSGIIQIPNNYVDDPNKSYSSENQNENTFDESILKTITRDLTLIYYKLKYILNPFSSPVDKRYHIMMWDLWGPLLFITLLSCTLSMSSKDKENVMVLVFSIFWIGSFLVYLNATLLDSKIRIFPIICLLGYCLFPLIVAAFILSLVNIHDILKLLLVGLMCFYSLFCIYSYIKTLCEKDQKILVFYPVVLMFIFISWFIFVN
jgi:hypothetical protein